MSDQLAQQEPQSEQQQQQQEKIDELDNLSTLSKSNEPLEEVEKVLTYLSKKSVTPTHHDADSSERAEASQIRLCSDIKNLSLDESTNREVEQLFENVSTSKDFDSDFSTSHKLNDASTNFTSVTATLPELLIQQDEEVDVYEEEKEEEEENAADDVENDSLDQYITEFQQSQVKSKSDFDYEEPTPRLESSSLSSGSLYKEDVVTEITVSVKERKPRGDDDSSQLTAILFLKDRKSKRLNKMAHIYPAEYIYAPLERSETRWLVYPINTDYTPKKMKEVAATTVAAATAAAVETVAAEYDVAEERPITEFSSPSMASYASQFKSNKKATLSSYEAADEDYFTEAQPENVYLKQMLADRPIALVTHLGVVQADPDEYKKMYENELVETTQLPRFLHKIQPPSGIALATQSLPRKQKTTATYELEGDIEAFKYIDLDKEGLSEYKEYLASRGIYHITNECAPFRFCC